ncbi:alpha/beta hydrolase [uncultured Erythrobacter sp.]|uniref:alpha/beta fold hydrolase n=1 Tax=uncultured Erythrobacter sp. TaxID=263913 RepID=UPI0026082F6E|nr:alpha/beta hydrolase [uncultured Erythrobacter sp.]
MERTPSWNPPEGSGTAIRFVETKGLTFEVAEAGEGDHLALMLHGFPELHYSWRHQMPLLAEKGYRVWAPNLRGYGATDRPSEVRDYALDHLTQDVADLIDASGAKQVTLIAHDWGAIIAWLFAITKKRPLQRLIIMNVPHPMPARRELRKWRQLKKSWYIFFFQLPWLPELFLARKGGDVVGELIANTSCNKKRFGPDVRAIYSEASKRPGARRAMINYYRALLRHDDTVDPGDFTIDIPTLMVWGEEDIAIDIHCTHGTEEWVSDLTLKQLPGVSHWVQQDAPEQVNTILEEWLPNT